TSPGTATITLTVPPQLQFPQQPVAVGSGVACTPAGTTITCTLPALSLNQGRDISLSFVAGVVLSTTSACIDARINVNETITTNNTLSKCGSVTPIPPVDRSLTVATILPGPFQAGTGINYQVTVKVEQSSSVGPFTVLASLGAGHDQLTAAGAGWN